MKTNNYLLSPLLAILILAFTGCLNKTSKNENTEEAMIQLNAPVKQVFDPSEGCHLAGPEMTKMLGDTLGIVMYEFIMKPGDSVAWHQHPYHTIYVLEGGTMAVYFEDMKKQVFELPTGLAMLESPSGDAAVNIGDTTIRLLTHDIYSLDPQE